MLSAIGRHKPPGVAATADPDPQPRRASE